MRLIGADGCALFLDDGSSHEAWVISIRFMDDRTTEHRERISLKDAAPEGYRAMAAFDRSIELDPSLRELVKIRASQINGCAYCIAMHTRDARKAGESDLREIAVC